MESLLKKIVRRSVFNESTKILLILTYPDDHWEYQTKLLWHFSTWRIHNIVSIDESHFEEASYITYHKYRPPGQEKFEIIHQPRTLDELFPDKTNNLNGNPISIFQFDDFPYNRLHIYPRDVSLATYVIGINSFLFALIQQKLNCRVNMSTYWDHSEYGNGNFSYSQGADLMFQLFPVQSAKFSNTQFSYPYLVDDTCIMVHKKSPSMSSILDSLWNSSSFWFLLGIAGEVIGGKSKERPVH